MDHQAAARWISGRPPSKPYETQLEEQRAALRAARARRAAAEAQAAEVEAPPPSM